ncbi:hypothetical protein [Psychromicrobium sp. YIM B11713]|uniref:hypothetical protein n=1 Tax=Psychromicrobium sp. YIM B11713 TaxID=3145233 RepID=UPI00374FBDE3
MVKNGQQLSRGMKGGAALLIGVVLLAALGLPAVPAQASVIAPQGGVAYLQGWRQGQLLCSGAPFQNKLKEVVLEPFAFGVSLPGDCNLAEMKVANPQTKFLAYVDVAASREKTQGLGDWSEFQPDCVDAPDSAADPRASLFVQSGSAALAKANALVKMGDKSFVQYPDQGLFVADISSQLYRANCANRLKNILTTPSRPGRNGEPAAYFDGVLLDDVNVSPQHGINIEDVGGYGPWTTSAQYGDDMMSMVNYLARQTKATAGRDVLVWVNMGVDPTSTKTLLGKPAVAGGSPLPSTESQRGLRLIDQRLLAGAAASTPPLIDAVLREYSVQWADGGSMSDSEMKAGANFAAEISRRGSVPIMHDYSVDLRKTSLSNYSQGAVVPWDAPCLSDDDFGAWFVAQSASGRRTADQRMSLGWTLLNKSSDAKQMVGAVAQAQPFCQNLANGYESVDTASVNLQDSMVQKMLALQVPTVYSTTPITQNGQLSSRLLNNGLTVFVNTGNSTATFIYKGWIYFLQGRDSMVL